MAWEKFENIKGPKGDKGDTGSVASASVATLPPGSSATVVISGASDPHMHFGIPQGEKGDRGPAGLVSTASATTLPAGEQAYVRLSGSGEIAHMDIGVPIGLPGTNALESDAAVAAYAASPASETGVVLRQLFGRIVWNNVRDFGAAGDGEIDDTDAVQAAIDALPDTGGTIYFPPGRYVFRGWVRVPSNTEITGNGAVLEKLASPGTTTAVVFAGLGADGTVENIKIHGLSFRGEMPAWGVCVFWGHRAYNVHIHNIVVDGAVTRGHVIDLQGCRNVVIEDSVFRGCAPAPGRELVEAIQLDVSAAAGASIQGLQSEVFDGSATQEVTVRRCRAEKLGPYPAPRLIGSHSVVEGQWYRNVSVLDNYMERPAIVPEGAASGVLNFWAVENCVIERNRFELGEGPGIPAVVRFIPTSAWMLLSSVNDPAAQNVPADSSMKGLSLSVSDNYRDTGAITMVQGNATDLVLDGDNFDPYPGYTAPRTYVAGGRVYVSGVLRIVPAGHVATASVGFSDLNDDLRPAEAVVEVTSGSGTSTVVVQVSPAGRMSLARYAGTQPANAWVPLNLSWPKK